MCVCGEVLSGETTILFSMLSTAGTVHEEWRQCVCMCVRLCGIFRLTKGNHSHPLAPPHPRVLRGLLPRGVDTGEGHFSYVSLDPMMRSEQRYIVFNENYTMGVVSRAGTKIMQTWIFTYLITYPAKYVPNHHESNKQMLSSSQEPAAASGP